MRTRVLHISTGLELGGAERILLNCAVEGRNQGFDSRIVALKSGGPTRHALEGQNFGVVELGASAALPDPLAMRRLLAEIAVFRPHIVKSWMHHGNIFSLLAASLSRHVTRQQLVWGIYNSNLDLAQYSWRMKAVVKAGAWASAFPGAIVYNSRKAMTDHRDSGYRARREILINNGVDTSEFKPDPLARVTARARLGISEDARVAMIVARVDPQKDWATVLKGVSMVQGLTTLAVGPTTSALAPQPGLLTHGAHASMRELYPAADIFILPSAFGEGTSVAMSEAMACGVPVIVTDVGDNALYAARGGFVIPSGDPAALAGALRGALADRDGLARLGAEARRTAVEHFGPATSFEPLFEYWRSMASGGRGR